AMINMPVFPFRTPEDFYEQLQASRPDPATGKADPERMTAFRKRHPEFDRALAEFKPTSGFADSTFYGLNAFRFTNPAGDTVPVRWQLKPEEPPEKAGEPRDKNYLFDDLITRLGRQPPLRWHLIVIIGQAGDPTDDASAAWPERREQVDMGTLT